ncbi:hypothetical protein EJ08DRAFT_651019 [Tothia fuscella]|uniref:Uncharacterized protein n=1 Tax=Tothia fuscella TaxID=1048955 RepID=A0A9P4TWX7_9PEZI|nr:hypothetical protein EJ08DRAFT_651019 [Tothia fuscella]
MGAQTTSKEPAQPSVARMYDYYLRGTTNHAIDRLAVVEVAKAVLDCFNLCLGNRSFLRRAVRYSSRFLNAGQDLGS